VTTLETVGLLVGVAIVSGSLLYASFRPAPSMALAAVALFGLAILGAWIADPLRADTLIPLLGVALGGLVSALTNLFDNRRKDD
jgi:ABC-type enterochelin transport system permease subunit